MNGNLVSAVWPQSHAQLLNKTVSIVFGVLLLSVSSKVQVPFWPVPMTLQTLVVLLLGASYGARLGGSTLLSYLAAGAIGLPVFAKGAGLANMAGPTGGYLAGFLVAAVLIGWLADSGYGRTIFSAIAGGLMPFIPAEILKVALASAMLALAWKRTKT